MKLFLSTLLATLLLPASVLAAPRPASTELPSPHVLTSVPVGSGKYAVLYADHGSFVGLLVKQQGRQVLIWHQRLPLPATKLFTVGTHGAFAGLGHSSGSNEGEFFAYRLASGQIRPAVAASTNGIVTAAEGVHTSHGDMLARVHDAAHQGSVSYAEVTRYRWDSTQYAPVATTIRPDYATADLPHPRGLVKTKHGDTILIRLEVANTEQERETGLMNRTSLDPDSGMIFVWPGPTLESFWMENTYIPLTVAFLAPDGTIQEMQDMQPLTTDLHTPRQLYQYAIEANLGFFTRYGIQVGDKIALQLQ